MTDPFFPALVDPSDAEAIRFDDTAVTFRQLAGAASSLAMTLRDHRRVVVLTHDRVETVVALVGCLLAGVCAVPVSPRSGPLELEHLAGDSTPDAVLTPDGVDVPDAFAGIEVIVVDPASGSDVSALGVDEWPEPDPEAPALVMYTSGTTGPPKGAVLPRRALTFDLDALATVWRWTDRDTLVHALPLYHVHGLVLGVLGPLRIGGRLHHLSPFDPTTVADALESGGTMFFGVPTMYRRLADAARHDSRIAPALAGARLLVSGSAGLPLAVHDEIEGLTGRPIVERYGMTETCITTAVPADDPRPGTVGPPLPGIDLRLLDDEGDEIADDDRRTMGEIAVRGPSLFLGYLNRPEATAELVHDGWVRSGDMATRDADGFLRIAGRRSTDIIKSGGFKIGAGEIESALLEHDAVDEAAVKALPHDDLGEQVAAWIVLRPGSRTTAAELARHVAERLSPHKRPREVFFVAELPRNAMGKVQKTQLEPS